MNLEKGVKLILERTERRDLRKDGIERETEIIMTYSSFQIETLVGTLLLRVWKMPQTLGSNICMAALKRGNDKEGI